MPKLDPKLEQKLEALVERSKELSALLAEPDVTSDMGVVVTYQPTFFAQWDYCGGGAVGQRGRDGSGGLDGHR